MLECIIIACILILDQVSKYFSEKLLTPLGTSFPVIDGVFSFTSVHNTGAAWGMLSGFRWAFLVMTVVVCAILVSCLVRYRAKLTVLSRITLSLLLAGALGNAIDRAALGYVRDMLNFCLINFPVFNVADSSLTIGCVLLCIDALFGKERSLFEVVGAREKPSGEEPGNPHADGE